MFILDKIIALLKEQGKSQKELCEYLGIKQQAFTNWKGGNNTSYMKYLPQIAEYFHVSVDYLLGNTDEKNPPAKSQGDTVALHITDFHGQEPEVVEISREKYEKIQKILKIMEDEQDKESDNDSRIF